MISTSLESLNHLQVRRRDQMEITDDLLDKFDDAWQRRETPSIEEFLPHISDVNRRQLLVELIKIDLEYRWRDAGSEAPETGNAEQVGVNDRSEDFEQEGLPWFPLLRDYQRRFPLLGRSADLPLDLILEEYRVRRRLGDQPSHRQYEVQFGSGRTTLSSQLFQIDRELKLKDDSQFSARQPFVGSLSDRLADQNSHRELQIGDEIDDFCILNKLGSGAFAEVFLAQQKSMQRLVALKVSKHSSHEPKVLSKLDHPNIVRVFDERKVGEFYLIYMQYVAGGNLQEIISHLESGVALQDRNGQSFLDAIEETMENKGEIPALSQRITPVKQMDWGTTVAWIGARLADALHHAHDNEVFHRDIKLENILIGSDGRPMLLDFNLSFGRSVYGQDGDDNFGGSLAYMSPQQLEVILGRRESQEVNVFSDFYSLSIVLWELLTGVRPFEPDPDQDHTTIEEMLERRQLGPDGSKLPDSCPGGLKRTLLECLSPGYASQSDSTSSIVRRLHLSLLPDVDRLLTPKPESWMATWARRPTFWLLLYGVIPSLLMSILNIWANHRLTIQNFDKEFFVLRQQPVINFIAFSAGTIFALWILRPVLSTIHHNLVGIEAPGHLRTIAYRCLSAPGWIAATISGLWIASGIAFPLWNYLSPASQIGPSDFLVFFVSQVLHGLIAASTTFVVVSLITISALFPRLLIEQPDRIGQERLDRVDRQLAWCTSILGLTPLLAIFVLAVTDQVEKPVFVALAIVGFLGHLISLTLTPIVRERLNALKLALAKQPDLVSAASQRNWKA